MACLNILNLFICKDDNILCKLYVKSKIFRMYKHVFPNDMDVQVNKYMLHKSSKTES